LHSTPVWFEYEGGAFYFWLDRHSVKGRNLTRDPEVAVCIATSTEPYQYVSASGTAELATTDSPDRCFSITRRYYDEPRARAFVKEDMATPGSLLLVLRPRRVVSERAA
jgi:PPOX class probable F420-dependent enzyme